MANVIQIKRGTTTPTTTNISNDGEMAYDKSANKLYINNAGTIESIGGVGWDTNTDTKVTQNAAITTNASYPIILGAAADVSSATTSTVNKCAATYINPNSGIIHGTSIEGKGTIVAASSAPTAATHDFWIDTSESGSIPTAYNVANNCETSAAGSYVLDAYQGKVLQDQIDNLSTYSTSEQVIGQWIDGKPLYRKVITGTTTAGATTISTGLSNIVPISLRFRIKNTNNNSYTFDSYTYNSSSDILSVFMASDCSSVTFRSGTSYAFGEVIIILEYTKTTD